MGFGSVNTQLSGKSLIIFYYLTYYTLHIDMPFCFIPVYVKYLDLHTCQK